MKIDVWIVDTKYGFYVIFDLFLIDKSLTGLQSGPFAHPQSARRAAKRIAKKLGLELEWI